MIDPVTFWAGVMVSRLLAPIVKDGWKKITNADAKKEAELLKSKAADFQYKLELQRLSHEDRLNEAQEAHKKALELWRQEWKEKTYYERCWPLRNPFEMLICDPISDDKSYFGNNIIVPCRLISALKDKDHPFARTINGNLSSFIVNYYPTNSVHAVVSEIGAWKDDVPSNDASVNYLYAGLKKQPVMVLSPTLINDGKTFIFKVWSWGLGEELNYPAGFEFGRLELKPLYIKAVYEETLSMVKLAQDMNYATNLYSKKLLHNISIIKEIQNKGVTGEEKAKMLSFLDEAPEINDAVKVKMESTISGIFCCMAGMYADAYHLLEYKTLPKLPSILHTLPGIEFMIPSLKDYYYTLLKSLEIIESDKTLLSQMYLDVASAFSRLKFSFVNRENIIEPFATKALGLFIKNWDETIDDEHLKSLDVIKVVVNSNPDLQDEEFIQNANDILERSKLKRLC